MDEKGLISFSSPKLLPGRLVTLEILGRLEKDLLTGSLKTTNNFLEPWLNPA